VQSKSSCITRRARSAGDRGAGEEGCLTGSGKSSRWYWERSPWAISSRNRPAAAQVSRDLRCTRRRRRRHHGDARRHGREWRASALHRGDAGLTAGAAASSAKAGAGTLAVTDDRVFGPGGEALARRFARRVLQFGEIHSFSIDPARATATLSYRLADRDADGFPTRLADRALADIRTRRARRRHDCQRRRLPSPFRGPAFHVLASAPSISPALQGDRGFLAVW